MLAQTETLKKNEGHVHLDTCLYVLIMHSVFHFLNTWVPSVACVFNNSEARSPVAVGYL